MNALISSNEERKACWAKVEKTMIGSISNERRKGKGIHNRKMFLAFLRCALRPFQTEEEEYKYINKFGRGMWAKHIIESFNEEEQELISKVIAVEFGAFNY